MSIWDEARPGSWWKSTRRPRSKPLLVIEKKQTTPDSCTSPSNKEKSGTEWRFLGISNNEIVHNRFEERLEFESELLQAGLDAGLDPNIHLQLQDIAQWMSSRSCVPKAALRHEKAWPHWNTPLHRALLMHDLKSVFLLLDHGADVNIRNALGKTPLHEAIILFPKPKQTVPLLISHGADVNAAVTAQKVVDPTPKRCREITSRGGVTPLHMAFVSGSAALIRTLVQAGAWVKVVSDDGWSLFDLVLLDQQWSTLATLFDHGAKPSMPQAKNGGTQGIAQDAAQLAKKLLCYTSTRDLFPPSECLSVYHYILGQKECHDALTSVQSNPRHSQHLIHTFVSMLRDVARSPLPKTSNSFRASCLEESQQQHEVAHDGGQYPDAYSPLQVSTKDPYTSANGGCPFCGVSADQIGDNLGNKAPDMAGNSSL